MMRHFELSCLPGRRQDGFKIMFQYNIRNYSVCKFLKGYTHFDEHGTPQLFDINVPYIFPLILISMSQLMPQLTYPGFPKFHLKSNLETRLGDFEGSVDAKGLADLGIMTKNLQAKTEQQNNLKLNAGCPIWLEI